MLFTLPPSQHPELLLQVVPDMLPVRSLHPARGGNATPSWVMVTQSNIAFGLQCSLALISRQIKQIIITDRPDQSSIIYTERISRLAVQIFIILQVRSSKEVCCNHTE